MKQKFSIDRIEGDIAVCYDENAKKYEFSTADVGLARGSLFKAELVDGKPTAIVYLEHETKKKKTELKGRMDALFNRTK